jgi:hypothetical protein
MIKRIPTHCGDDTCPSWVVAGDYIFNEQFNVMNKLSIMYCAVRLLKWRCLFEIRRINTIYFKYCGGAK